MGGTAIGSWSPPGNDELTWFREDRLFAKPRPLEYSLEVHALTFGLTHALESLEFPLYEFRSRLHHGRLYLAVVPSAMAERDLPHRMQNIRDQSLRFTRDVGAAWERQIKPEVESYNTWFEETGRFEGDWDELVERCRQLRRIRGNQWYAMIRGVAASTAMLRKLGGSKSAEALLKAERATAEALDAVARRGSAHVDTMLHKIGKRFVDSGSIKTAEDIFWLEWAEFRENLEGRTDRHALVAERKANAERWLRSDAPEQMGPPLPPDAPRMYLITEILSYLAAIKPIA